MSEFKGTKGKWMCYRKTDQHKIEEILTKEGVSICAIPYNLEESEANAKLIVRSLEMLESIKELIRVFEVEATDSMQSDAIYYAKELIKKATE